LSAAERLDVFMARANAAYYATHDPFADFTTAPEIAQMFGEIIGAWAAIVWQQMGAPPHIVLAEAGPGRGTLMQDALRLIARAAPAFRTALRVHFIETSPRLRGEQAARVPHAVWHDDLDDLPAAPTILIANEFLDALPIRQFVRADSGWTERLVADGRFVHVQAPDLSREAPAGAVVEISDAIAGWTARLARRVAALGGAALILDYGTAHTAPGDSLQALRGGEPADPLADPGSADLTAHVDFSAVATAARAAGAASWGPIPQGAFLTRLGLRERTERLIAANPARREELRRAAERLASPARMGLLFKALCLTQQAALPPPGFEP